MKFASYAGVGAVVAGATLPLLWVPFLGVGFLLAAFRPEGRSLESFLVQYLRFRWRSGRPGRSGPAAAPGPVRGSVARLPSGRYVGVLAAGGIPMAFLPARDARSLFDAFRGMLRAHDGGLLLVSQSLPVPAVSRRLPEGPVPQRDESLAREGYREMVHVLLRRVRRREVRVVAWSDLPGPGALLRLEERLQALSGGLLSLGVPAERLRDRRLSEALASIGWRLPT